MRLEPKPTILSMLATPVRYSPKFEVTYQRRPLCLNCGQFTRYFFRGAAIRANHDDPREHGSARYSHDRWIEPNSADDHGDENVRSEVVPEICTGR